MILSLYDDFFDFIGNSEIDNQLRDYQQQHKLDIYNSWKKNKNVMLQMPTGTGKTRLFVSICKDIFKYSAHKKHFFKVLVLAHRAELIEQISDNLSFKYGLAHSKIVSNCKPNFKNQFQIASVQTLNRRIADWENIKFDFIIIDEAHHAVANSYVNIIKNLSNGYVRGVTATPVRLGQEGFTHIFNDLILSLPVKKFIEKKILSGYDYFSIKPDSKTQHLINELEIDRTGDYKESNLINKFDNKGVRANVLNTYLKYANNKKGIIYTINLEHNKHICDTFNNAGIISKAIDSNTKSDERKRIISEFKNGEIKVLCNVNIFSEGFDCPDIEFIQLARPTTSLAMYLQQIGRGLRTHELIEKVIFLDNVGMFNRFGLPSTNRKWNYHFEGHAKVDYSNEITQQMSNEKIFYIEEGDEEIELIEQVDNIHHNKKEFIYFNKKTQDDELILISNVFDFNTINEIIQLLEIDEADFDIYTDLEDFDVTINTDLALFFENEKVGLKFNNSNVICLAAEYDKIDVSDLYGLSIIHKGNKVGLFDCTNKKIIVDTIYDAIENCYDNFNLITTLDGRNGLFNYNTNKFISPIFNDVLVYDNIHCLNEVEWVLYDREINRIDINYNELTVKVVNGQHFVKFDNKFGCLKNNCLIFPFIINDILNVGELFLLQFYKFKDYYQIYNKEFELIDDNLYSNITINGSFIVAKNNSLNGKFGVLEVINDHVNINIEFSFSEIILNDEYMLVRNENNKWALYENDKLLFQRDKKKDVLKDYEYYKSKKSKNKKTKLKIIDIKNHSDKLKHIDLIKKNETDKEIERRLFIAELFKNHPINSDEKSIRMSELYKELQKDRHYFQRIFDLAEISLNAEPKLKVNETMVDIFKQIIEYDS